MILSGATHFLGAGKMSAWFPPEASYHTIWVDDAFFYLYVAAAHVVVLIVGLALVHVIRHKRRKEEDKGAAAGRTNILLQGLWVLAAVAIGVLSFSADFCGFIDRSVAPLGAMEVDVTARQWDWDFTYPNGHVADTLHVAYGEPVKLNLRSGDVAHSLLIPALRINQGILPDRTTEAWFETGLIDTFNLRSSTFSGPGYSEMKSAVISHRPRDFHTWLQATVDIFAGRTLVEVGELLYAQKSCKTCHSIDGSKLVGPSLKDVYGNTFDTREGERVIVDEAYIRESILQPNVSIIDGFEPAMTPYEGKITDREIEAITAWMKTLSSFASNLQEGE